LTAARKYSLRPGSGERRTVRRGSRHSATGHPRAGWRPEGCPHAPCRCLATIRSRRPPGLRDRHAGGRVIRVARALRSFVSTGTSPAHDATASARSPSCCFSIICSRRRRREMCRAGTNL